MMFRIVYLPTSELVRTDHLERPWYWFESESRTRAFLDGNICVYESPCFPYMHFISSKEYHDLKTEVPLHLLDIVEIKDV